MSDYKGALDFRFGRIIEREEDLFRKKDILHSFNEISSSSFDHIVSYLIGWVEGLTEAYCEFTRPAKPFYRTIPTTLTIYGFEDGNFFYECYEDSSAFEAKKNELRAKTPDQELITSMPNTRITLAKACIERVKQESLRK
jgi:hypothetical protein